MPADDISEISSETTDDDDNSDPDIIEEEIEPSLVSPKICKISDRRFVSVRSAALLLNEAASSCQKPEMKTSSSTLYRQKCRLRDESLIKGQEFISNCFVQYAFDGKKLFQRERMAVL